MLQFLNQLVIKKIYLYLLAISVIVSACSAGLVLDDLDSTLRQLNLSKLPDQENYPDADAVIILDLTHNQLVQEKDNLVTYELHHIIKKIFRNTNEQSTVNIYVYQDEELLGIKARTIRPDGKMIDLKSDDFYTISGLGESSILFSDIKIIRFTFPAVEKDCLIEYAIEKKINEPFVNDVWQIQNDSPTLRNQYSLSMPMIMSVFIPYQYKIYPEHMNIEPIVNTDQIKGARFTDPITYTWARSSIPAFKPEDRMPPIEMYRARMRFSRTSWMGWNGIAEWYYNTFFKSQLVITDSLRSFAKQLIGSSSSTDEKIKSIYSYVQRIRYVAIQLGQSGLQPAFAQDVLNRKYGDCKDKAILCIALLRSLGIEAFPVLVLTADIGILDSAFPNWDFNHMIVKAKSDNNTIFWMDPTSEYSPFGSLPWEDQNITVLAFNNDGNGSIETTPIQDSNNFSKYFVKINVLDIGLAEVKTTLTFCGEKARYYRLLFTDKSNKEIIDICKETILNEILQAEIDSISILNLNDLDSVLILNLDFQIPNFIQKQGDLYYFRSSIFKEVSNLEWTKKESREYPIWFPFGLKIQRKTEMNIADSLFVLHSLPNNVVFHYNDFYYRNNIDSTSPRSIKMEETFSLKRSVIPPTGFISIKEFFQNIQLSMQRSIFVKRRQTKL